MLLKLLYLGPARDLTGVDEETLDLAAGARLADIGTAVTKKHPRLGRALSSMRLAVNLAFVPQNHALRDGDEIAVIPPVSGGAGSENVLVSLKAEPINAQNVRAFVYGDPAYGGIVTFEGGLPIKTAGGAHIGAIGVSGASAEQDGMCAQAALDAVANDLK